MAKLFTAGLTVHFFCKTVIELNVWDKGVVGTLCYFWLIHFTAKLIICTNAKHIKCDWQTFDREMHAPELQAKGLNVQSLSLCPFLKAIFYRDLAYIFIFTVSLYFPVFPSKWKHNRWLLEATFSVVMLIRSI